jgi:hypothetical protein
MLFEMTSKMLYVAGMKAEPEVDDVYLDFIRKVKYHQQSEEIMRNLK